MPSIDWLIVAAMYLAACMSYSFILFEMTTAMMASMGDEEASRLVEVGLTDPRDAAPRRGVFTVIKAMRFVVGLTAFSYFIFLSLVGFWWHGPLFAVVYIIAVKCTVHFVVAKTELFSYWLKISWLGIPVCVTFIWLRMIAAYQ